MKFLSLYPPESIPQMYPGGASVILLVVMGPCGSNLLRIQNMNIITIVFKVGLIDFSTLFYELY